jgi:hypothetical protein
VRKRRAIHLAPFPQADKRELLMARWRYPSLSIHGIEVSRRRAHRRRRQSHRHLALVGTCHHRRCAERRGRRRREDISLARVALRRRDGTTRDARLRALAAARAPREERWRAPLPTTDRLVSSRLVSSPRAPVSSPRRDADDDPFRRASLACNNKKTKQNKLKGAFSEPGAKTVIPRLVKGEWCFLFVLDPFLAPDPFVSCGGVVV